MQTITRPADDFVGSESFYEPLDFPSEEELLAALDASLAPPPWPPLPLAVDATSRALTQHWPELAEPGTSALLQNHDDLRPWVEDSAPACECPIEPDFLADFMQFLINRLAQRLRETQQAQQLLRTELARFRGC